jgi:hypothetical protein
MMPEVDEELAAVWRRWWLSVSVPDSPTPVDHADDELASLLEHLAIHGFAIVRRFLAADT